MSLKKTGLEIPSILHKDQDLIVINKPAGLHSVADGYDPTLPHLKDLLEPLHGALWIVHRLDKETSGVMLLARNAEMHRKLNQAFRERKVNKIYHGLVTPVPDWRENHINLNLLTDADRKHRTRALNASGKQAHSYCKVLKIFPHGVLMMIEITTGITHQIRAHLRVYDLALFGDILYNAGLPDQPFQTPRPMLHARSIAFQHPKSKQPLVFSTRYPQDFRDAYTKLRTTRARDAEI